MIPSTTVEKFQSLTLRFYILVRVSSQCNINLYGTYQSTYHIALKRDFDKINPFDMYNIFLLYSYKILIANVWFQKINENL